jgi:hypothetical protein
MAGPGDLHIALMGRLRIAKEHGYSGHAFAADHADLALAIAGVSRHD